MSTSQSGVPKSLPPGESQQGLRAYVTLLRQNANLRNLWIGSVISQLGDWFNSIALLGLVLELTKNPASASLVIVLQGLPSAIVGILLAGAVADRFDRRKIMLAADLARAVIAFTFLWVHDVQTVWIAYVALTGLSVGNAFFSPASAAALPNLVAREDLPTANALQQSTFASMILVGAALGGAITQTFGRSTAFVINGLSFLGSAYFIWRTHGAFNAQQSKQVVSGAGAIRILTEGFRYLKATPTARAYALIKPYYGWIFGAIGLYGAYSLNVYHAGDQGTSWLYLGRGVGALISPLLIASRVRLTDTKRLGRVIRVGMGITIAGYVLFAFSTSPIAGVIGTFFGHFGAAMVWTFSRMILQMNTPDYVRGRVMALDEVMFSIVVAASNALVGLVAHEAGLRAGALTAVTAASVGATLWIISTWQVDKKAEQELATTLKS